MCEDQHSQHAATTPHPTVRLILNTPQPSTAMRPLTVKREFDEEMWYFTGWEMPKRVPHWFVGLEDRSVLSGLASASEHQVKYRKDCVLQQHPYSKPWSSQSPLSQQPQPTS